MSNEAETEPSPYPAPPAADARASDAIVKRNTHDSEDNMDDMQPADNKTHHAAPKGLSHAPRTHAAAVAAPTTSNTTGGCYYYPSTSTCDQSSSTHTGAASETVTPLSGDSHETSPAVPLSNPGEQASQTADDRSNQAAGPYGPPSTPFQEPPSKLVHREASSTAHVTDLAAAAAYEASSHASANAGSGAHGANGERAPSRQRKAPLDANIRRGSHAAKANEMGVADATAIPFSSSSSAAVIPHDVVAAAASVIAATTSTRRSTRLGLRAKHHDSGASTQRGRNQQRRGTRGVADARASLSHPTENEPAIEAGSRRRGRPQRDGDGTDNTDSSEWEDAEEWNMTVDAEERERERAAAAAAARAEEEDQQAEEKATAEVNQRDIAGNEEEGDEEAVDAPTTRATVPQPPPMVQSTYVEAPAGQASFVHQKQQVFRSFTKSSVGEGLPATGATATSGVSVHSDQNSNGDSAKASQTPPLLFERLEAPLVISLTESRFARAGISRFVTMLCLLSKQEPIPKSDFHSHCLPPMSVHMYVERIERYCNCSGEALLCGLLLMLKYAFFSHHPVTIYSAHRLLITSAVLGIKMRDDLYYNNLYYAKIGGISVREMNKLEMLFLSKLNWDMDVCPKQYAQLRGILGKLTENVREKEGFLARFADQHPEEVEAYDADAMDEAKLVAPPANAAAAPAPTNPASPEEQRLARIDGAYRLFYWNSVVQPWLAELERQNHHHATARAQAEQAAWAEEEAKWYDYRRRDEEELQSSQGSSRWMSPTSVSNIQSAFPEQSPFANSEGLDLPSRSHSASLVHGGQSHNISHAMPTATSHATAGGANTRYANFVSYNNSSMLLHNSSGGGYPTIRDATGVAAVNAKHTAGFRSGTASGPNPLARPTSSHARHRNASAQENGVVGRADGMSNAGAYGYAPRSHSNRGGATAAHGGYPSQDMRAPNYTNHASGTSVTARASAFPAHPVMTAAALQQQQRDSGSNLCSPSGVGGNETSGNFGISNRAESASAPGVVLSEQQKESKESSAEKVTTPSSKLNINAQPYQYVSRRQQQKELQLQQLQQQQHQQQQQLTVAEIKGGGDRNDFYSSRGSALGARKPSSASLTGTSFRPSNGQSGSSPTPSQVGSPTGSTAGAPHMRFTNWRSSDATATAITPSSRDAEIAAAIAGRKRGKPEHFVDHK